MMQKKIICLSIIFVIAFVLLFGVLGCEPSSKPPVKMQAKITSKPKSADSNPPAGTPAALWVTAEESSASEAKDASQQARESGEAVQPVSASSAYKTSDDDSNKVSGGSGQEDAESSEAPGASDEIIESKADTSSCNPMQQEFITDLVVRQETKTAVPGARVQYTDPVFGTCITRVTDAKQDKSAEDESAGIKNEYSRVQAFNSDNTRFIIRGIAGTWYIYSTSNLEPVKEISIGTDPRWDSENPDILYHSDGTGLYSYDVDSDKNSLLHDFASDFPGKELAAAWTRYEGSPSYDSRYWGIMAQDNDWKIAGFAVYDAEEDKVLAKRDIAGEYGADSVTISPSGDYFLAYFDNYCEHGELGTDSSPCGLMVYDRDLTNGRGLLRIIGHSDTAVDAKGDDVLVYQDIDTDSISMLNLKTGKVTALFPIDFSHTSIGLHFSGRASKVPGWALVSTYNGGSPSDYTWMDDQIFAVELRENGKVARLAHHHSLYNEEEEHDYWAEPHATVNQDFTRVLFTSNWGKTGTEEVETYMISLPRGWTGKI
jgi:hypothetical protein